MKRKISKSELLQALGVSYQRLTAYLRQGLPFEGSNGDLQFDAGAVAEWLKSNGKAVESKPPSPQSVSDGPLVLRTKGAVAVHFGVHKRTVGEWLDVPSFPGRSGDPGKSNREAWWNFQVADPDQSPQINEFLFCEVGRLIEG